MSSNFVKFHALDPSSHFCLIKRNQYFSHPGSFERFLSKARLSGISATGITSDIQWGPIREAWRSIERCFSEETWIKESADRLVRISLQIIARLVSWIQGGIETGGELQGNIFVGSFSRINIKKQYLNPNIMCR